MVALTANLLGGAVELRPVVSSCFSSRSSELHIPPVSADGQNAQGRAVGSNHTGQVRDVEADELHNQARLLVHLLDFLRLVAALDRTAVALSSSLGTRGRSSEDEERGSSGESDDTGEHLVRLVVSEK